MNACLWGLVAHRFARRVRARAGRTGFDAAAVSARIAEVRHNHVVAAHARSKPIYARKGLVAATCRAISQCEYFRAEPGRLEPDEKTKY